MKLINCSRLVLIMLSLCSGAFLSPILAQAPAEKNVLTDGSFKILDNVGNSIGRSGFLPNAKVVKETKADGAVNHYVVVAPNSSG